MSLCGPVVTNEVSTECVKWRLMLWQMRESQLHQMMHVRVTSDTQTIKSSDWPKCHCALWHYVFPAFYRSSIHHFKHHVDVFCIWVWKCCSQFQNFGHVCLMTLVKWSYHFYFIKKISFKHLCCQNKRKNVFTESFGLTNLFNSRNCLICMFCGIADTDYFQTLKWQWMGVALLHLHMLPI